MLTFKRTLSLLLACQIFWSCTSGGQHPTKQKSSPVNVTPSSSEDSFVFIKGSISKVMDLMLPSAMAANGEVIIEDISDIANPIVLEKQSIVDQDFYSIKLDSSLVQNTGLIRVSFISLEDNSYDRLLLMELDAKDSGVVGDLNETSSSKSHLLNYQLQLESVNGLISPDEIRSRFSKIKEQDLDSLINIFANGPAIKKLIHTKEYSHFVLEMLSGIREAMENNDQVALAQFEKVLKLKLMAMNLLDSSVVLNCKDNKEITLLFVNQKVSIVGVSEELEMQKFFGTHISLGTYDDPFIAQEYMRNFNLKIQYIANLINAPASIRLDVVEESGRFQSCVLSANPEPLKVGI